MYMTNIKNRVVEYYCSSNIGLLSKINQDYYVCDKEYMTSDTNSISATNNGCVILDRSVMFAVFDGIGGCERGEIASQIAAKCASDFIVNKNPIESLHDLCLLTNEKICRYQKTYGISAMGTTAAYLLFTPNNIYLCNVGDTKVFRYNELGLSQISKDQTIITAYSKNPLLLQSLGVPTSNKLIDPYYSFGPVRSGDSFLICSDGLTNFLSREEIEEIIRNNGDDEINEQLTQKALVNGAGDNITIILCKVTNDHSNKEVA